MSDTINAYAYVAEVTRERNEALIEVQRLTMTVQDIAHSLRETADETTDEDAARKLRRLAADIDRSPL